jgi:hypothetical protein
VDDLVGPNYNNTERGFNSYFANATGYLASGYPSSLMLGTATPEPLSARPSSRQAPVLAQPGQLPGFRSSYEEAPAFPRPRTQHQPRLARVPSAITSAGSSLNYTAYLAALSPNSRAAASGSSAGRSIAAQSPLRPRSGAVLLQPLDPATAAAALVASTHSGFDWPDTETATRSSILHLEPLDLGGFRPSDTGLLPAKVAATPKDLPVTSVRRQNSSDCSVGTPAEASTAFGVRQLRLPSFRLDSAQSSAHDLNSLAASKVPSSTRSRGGGAGLDRSLGCPPSASRAARLRQDAQLMLASPLSDWLSAGANLQTPPSGLAAASAVGVTPLPSAGFRATETDHASLAPQEELPSEDSPRRRGSKFTFEGLPLAAEAQLPQRAGSQRRLSHKVSEGAAEETKEIAPTLEPSSLNATLARSRRKGRTTEALTAISSLPSLLPSLATADPSAVSDVYRSLNILSGHFAQLSAQSLNSSGYGARESERGRDSSGDSLSDMAGAPIVEEGATLAAAAIDRELDDLLSGEGDRTPQGDTVYAAAPARPTVADSQAMQRSGSAGRGNRSARQQPLVSQSCVEGGPARFPDEGAVVAFPSINCLSCAEFVCCATGSGTSVDEGKTGLRQSAPLSARHQLQKLALMRPSAMSTTALHDAALSDRRPSSAVVTPTEVPPPVREQIEGVVAQALSRTAASSTASTPVLHRTHLVGASAAGAASDKDSSGASTPASQPVPAQSAQQQLQQRLGALAAALDAGDAVGKLMANMVMSAGASGAGSTNSSLKPGNAANPRKR